MLKKKKERKLNKKKHFLGVEPGSTHLLVCPPTTDHCSNTCSLCTRLVYNDILQPLYIKKKKKNLGPQNLEALCHELGSFCFGLALPATTKKNWDGLVVSYVVETSIYYIQILCFKISNLILCFILN